MGTERERLLNKDNLLWPMGCAVTMVQVPTSVFASVDCIDVSFSSSCKLTIRDEWGDCMWCSYGFADGYSVDFSAG